MMETTGNIAAVEATGSLQRIQHIKAGVIDFTAGSLGETVLHRCHSGQKFNEQA